MDEKRLARPHSGPRTKRNWTRVDDYLVALARRRAAHHRHEPKPRTEPEVPRFSLSTLPFLALLAALLVLSVAIIVLAWPGNQPRPQPKPPASHEQGYAPKGWLQEAEKEFH